MAQVPVGLTVLTEKENAENMVLKQGKKSSDPWSGTKSWHR